MKHNFKDPNNLTHEEQEREIQRVQEFANKMKIKALKIARAKLADLVERGLYPELSELRGRVVHAEIERRDKNKSLFVSAWRGLNYGSYGWQESAIESITIWLPPKAKAAATTKKIRN